MTDLDDALDRPNPIFHPVDIVASWRELWPNYDPGNSAEQWDDMRDLGQQVGPGGYTVSQSLDDGLPDPVTMTSGNDASGQFEAELVGREAAIADNLSVRTPMAGGTGTGTTITIAPSPVGNFLNDRVIVGVVIPSGITYTTNQDPINVWAWQLLGSVVDGTVQLLVFSLPVNHAGASSLILTLSASSTWVWTGVAVNSGSFHPAAVWVPTRPGTPVTLVESVSQTTHTLPNTYAKHRAWVFSFWATDTSNAWTTPMTELTESAGAPRLMMARTPVRAENWTEVGMTASTAVATATVAAIGIPIEILDRPRMDALQFFSPFNQDSPVFGYERDTAPLTVSQPVISPNGPVSTQLFEGTMEDITVSGRLAKVTGLSQTRLDLDRVVELPVIRANREGSSIDWLVAWLMSRGRRFIGQQATAYTRAWYPLYGSTHPFVEPDKFGYTKVYRYRDDNPGVLLDNEPVPDPIAGPFVTGMYAQYQEEEVIEVFLGISGAPMKGGATELGFDPIPDHTNDLMSQASNKGRLSFWIRGDASATTPAAIVGAPTWTDTLFRYRLVAAASGGGVMGEFSIWMRDSDRQIGVRFNSSIDGAQDLIMGSSALPADDEWHFICATWDFDAGTSNVRLDNTTWHSVGWATTTLSALPATEEALRTVNGYVFQQFNGRLPVADVMIEGGAVPYAAGVSEHWPLPTGNSANATYRATYQKLDSLVEESPVAGWATLAELARATLSHYRTDEQDNYQFLPPSFFGEPNQLTSTVVADTSVNASELDVIADPSKSRNVVTVEFNDTKTDLWSSYVIELNTATELPRGITDIVFTSDKQFVEIYGAWFTDLYFAMYKLTSAQLATPSTIPTDRHTMSVNTKSDGSGTVYASSGIRARIIDWTSSSVTIRFWNTYSTSLWLSNNGTNDVPFLRVRAYAITQATGYVTQRDAGSIGTRRERALATQMPWIHDRTTATRIAGTLVNMISRPRHQVTVEVMGDPRRTPGQLVTLADSEGTQAEGTWRILSCQHNGNGAQFTQILQLVRVLPVAVWDGPDGWDYAIWGE